MNDNEKSSPSRDLEAELRHFSGSERYYRHSLVQHIVYTDGARHLAQRGKAYWLLDEIAFAQTQKAVRAEEFQVWTLTVDREKMTGVLTCTDGDRGPGPKTVFTKAIDYTDFPLAEIKLWFAENTIYLPSEH